MAGGGGNDTLDGGAGNNAVSYIWSASGVTVDLNANTDSTGSTLKNIQNIVGSNGNDTITASNVWHDVLSGGAGNDLFEYGNGPTTTVDGGVGTNTMAYDYAAAVAIAMNGYAGVDSIGNTLTNIQQITGSHGSDQISISGSSGFVINGYGGGDTITGGSGNDTLSGGGGNDTLDGGAGTNAAPYTWSTSGVTGDLNANTDSTGGTLKNIQNIVGSNGNDTIMASNVWHDVLSGGAGNDLFEFGNGPPRRSTAV